MKPFLLFLFLLPLTHTFAQHTFSIVAVDTLTGEVGSAGASCLNAIQFPGSGGAYIISDVLPGRGAIHTQAFYLAANQANARARLEEGLSPTQVINWLKTNDTEPPTGSWKRQYGIADFDSLGNPRAAAYTGVSCQPYKGHRVGAFYAIQGNILLGPEILDSMEARFLQTPGPLANRLMAALQGANVPGADSRCLSAGVSSLSAFVRVARPGDADDQLYLDLNVPALPTGVEPIDSLQTLFDAWALTSTEAPLSFPCRVYPNPVRGDLTIEYGGGFGGAAAFYGPDGRLLAEMPVFPGTNRLQPGVRPGIVFLRIRSGEHTVLMRKLMIL